MTLDERKALALKLLKGVDSIVVAPGAEHLKLAMEDLIRDIARKVEAGEEVDLGDNNMSLLFSPYLQMVF